MKWHSLSISLILAAGVAVAHSPQGLAQTPRENAEARRLFNEGVLFQDRGNLGEAEKKFREALTKYPKAEQSDQNGLLSHQHACETCPPPGCSHRDRAIPQELSTIKMAAGRQ